MDMNLFETSLERAFKEDMLSQFAIDFAERLRDVDKAKSIIEATFNRIIDKDKYPTSDIKLHAALKNIDRNILYEADPYLDMVDRYEEIQNEDPIIIMQEINQIYFPHMGNKVWDDAYNKFLTNYKKGTLLEESFNPYKKIILNENLEEPDELKRILKIMFEVNTEGENEDYDDIYNEDLKEASYKAIMKFIDKYIDIDSMNDCLDSYDYDWSWKDASIILYIDEECTLTNEEILNKLPKEYNYTEETTQYGRVAHDTNYYEEPWYDENQVNINVYLVDAYFID